MGAKIVKTCKMNFKNIQALLFSFYASFNFYFMFILILFFSIFILYFYYYIFYLQTKTNNYKLNYTSLIKDKEYLLFKASLDKFYYSSMIILFYFMLKNNGLNLFLAFNAYFIYLLFTVLVIYSILFSNFFNLKLFSLYLTIKKNINLLNNFNFIPLEKNNNKFYHPKFNFKFNGLRNYSTNVDINSNLGFNELDSDLDNSKTSLIKELAVKDFKKTYSDGYLGYKDIYSFGNISTFFNVDDSFSREFYIKSLESEFKKYLKDIPENITYSILPIIRWQLVEGGYKSITISDSIKITRFTNCSLLSERIFYSLQKALNVYETNGIAIDLVMLSRPWLNENDFKFKLPEVTDILDGQIEKEISYLSSFSLQDQKKLSTKANNMRNYIYENIYMDNYGEPIYDKKNNLIGYKLEGDRYATITTYYNENNLLCNKVEIKDFDLTDLSFKSNTLISWIDIKTENGFIR